ncbi:MAG TPA: CrcB family protein [Ktedonobacterales bacterium]|jgi:CrcB protein|nr:CrcB family protein [Ktedonobacterales bacterium]
MSELAIVMGVGASGALGAVSRYLIVEWMARWWRKPFPLAILLINVTGAFLLGLVTTAFASPTQLDARLLLGVGFLGGYTTFSTLCYETFALGRRGDMFYGWLNVIGSLLPGVLFAALGLTMGAHMR